MSIFSSRISKMSFDTEEARMVDRIKACAFFEAREAGANFITKKWVANKLKRSEIWKSLCMQNSVLDVTQKKRS